MKTNQCPVCGNEEFETVKHSWKDGLPPHEDYYECRNCDHTWTDAEEQETGETK